ncbi:MAG: hypothetical protein WBE76_19130 [Terracidiphilus sp.]
MSPKDDHLTYSKRGLRLTEDFEGFRAIAYRDQGGVLRIRYGHTCHDVTKVMTITQAQAEILLAHEVEMAESFVRRVVKVTLT